MNLRDSCFTEQTLKVCHSSRLHRLLILEAKSLVLSPITFNLNPNSLGTHEGTQYNNHFSKEIL